MNNNSKGELYPLMFSCNPHAEAYIKLFLGVLLRYADKNTLESYPNRETIMQSMPCSRNMFFKTRRKLVASGLISLNNGGYVINRDIFIKYFGDDNGE